MCLVSIACASSQDAVQVQTLPPQAEAMDRREQAKKSFVEPANPQLEVLAKLSNEAAVGVSNSILQGLLRDHWTDSLERFPVSATELGVHLYDDRLSDLSPRAEEAEQRFLVSLHKQAAAIDPSQLSDSDKITHQLFLELLNSSIATDVCQFSSWSFSARSNVVTSVNHLAKIHQVKTIVDGRNLVARYSQIAPSIETQISNLRRGLKSGLVGNRNSTDRVIKMVRNQLAQTLEEWPLLTPLRAERPDWTEPQISQFRSDIRRRVTQEVVPALEHYLQFLEEELLPLSRDDKQVGLAALKVGKNCYETLIQRYTTTKLSSSEIHEIGKREVDRINREMKDLGTKLFGTRKFSKVLERLRNDSKLYFEDEKSVEAFAQESLEAAQSKIGEYFGRLPVAPCVVVRVPDFRAPFTTIAYYQPPAPDGSKPGEYFINVYEPKSRPRYEARALAFHESVPGHHLQIAIAQELPDVPAFRRFGGQTVFIEGWALYTERLADEMGLYRDDLERMGMLSFDAWRATRLVVDTGIHAFSWSRERAIKYLLDHTALAANNIDNEVDRYITTPGQALAYKIGQLEIFELREEATRTLGEKFRIREFHDTVLGAGAVSIAVLRDRIATYIARALE